MRPLKASSGRTGRISSLPRFRSRPKSRRRRPEPPELGGPFLEGALFGFGAKTPWARGRGRALGMGGHLFASRKNPRLAPGRSDLCGHLFGGARRAVVLVRVGFGLDRKSTRLNSSH